jgi:hypothetical protein
MTEDLSRLSSYCGLECKTCPIYLATTETDPDIQARMRLEIAEECSKLYRKQYKIEEITDCDGCITVAGRLFSGCSNCKIRECAIRKNIPNCAYCDDFACNELRKLFTLDPEAKARMEKIRKQYILKNN